MKRDPYYQQQKCSQGILVSSKIIFVRIFEGVRWRGGVKYYIFRTFTSKATFIILCYVAPWWLFNDTEINDLEWSWMARRTPRHCISSFLEWAKNQMSAFIIRMSMTWRYFKVIKLFYIKFLVNGALYGKSYYRVLIGNHTLAFDWCHVWRPWSTFEGHFSLICHFHVHFSNRWPAFASHGVPAIAELLVLHNAKRLEVRFQCPGIFDLVTPL